MRLSVDLCIYIYRERERETDRQTDRDRERLPNDINGYIGFGCIEIIS